MRHVKTFAGWLVLILSALILFVGVFAGVTIWRLSQEPISLHRLTPFIVDRLNQSMGNNRLSVGDFVLRWHGWEEKFDVLLRDVAVFGPDNDEILHVPEADVVFSSKALFEGVLALRELNLIGPRIRLERRVDGTIDIGYGTQLDADDLTGSAIPDDGTTDTLNNDGSRGQSVVIPLPDRETAINSEAQNAESDALIGTGEGPTAPENSQQHGATQGADTDVITQETPRDGGDVLHDIVSILAGERQDIPAAAYFEEFGVIDADLQVRDEKLGLIWAAPQADILLSRQLDGIAASASLDVSAGSVATHVDVEGTYLIRDGEIDLTAKLGDMDLSQMVTISDIFDPLRDAYVPVSGTVKAKLGQNGDLISASTDLNVGSGVITLPDEVRATYRVTGGQIQTSYVPGRFSLDDVILEVGEARAELQGVVLDPFGKWSVNLDAKATDVATNDLDRLWPENVGEDARLWVVTNLSEGIVHQATLHTELHQGEDDAVVLDDLGGQMTMSGVTVHYLGEMPSVIGAAGRAEFDETSFRIYADQGTADGLLVTDASILFTNLEQPAPDADIEVVAQGSVRKALELIEAEPLGFATRLGIDPAQVDGEQATRVRLHFPLLKSVTFDDVDVAAASRIVKAKVENAFRDLDVRDGEFELQVNRTGLELDGPAMIGSGKTNIKWHEKFDEAANPRSQYTLSGPLDLAVLGDVDIDVAPYLTGVAEGTVNIMVGPDRVDIGGDVALDNVVIDVAAIDYHKGQGQRGSAAFDLSVANDGGGQLRSLVLHGPDLSGEINGTWRGDNLLEDQWSVDLANVDFRRNTGISGAVRLDDEDRIVADLQGEQFDLRPFIEVGTPQNDDASQGNDPSVEIGDVTVSLSGNDFLLKGADPLINEGIITFRQTGQDKEIEVSASQLIATPWIVDEDGDDEPGPSPGKTNSGGLGEPASRQGGSTGIFLNIEQLVLANGEFLSEVEGSIRMNGQEWDSLVLNGLMGDRTSLFAQVSRDNPTQRTVTLTADDAGRFLRAFDMYDNLLGGELRVTGQVNENDPAQPLVGTVYVGNFRVVNAPIAARVLGAASLTGLGDVLQGNGLAFDELNGEFTYVNDVIALSKVAANGSALGVTANGSLDLAKSEIRLAGSIVPLYALNSALGAIPILGDLLVGEEGGGLFAPTYTIEGDMADPDVSVNPLSTFVPGVFRNLITGAEPG
ncbi:AsmA-like C-terminal domain-containing protein [Thalassospira sp. MA62]|nr:AsmA-like C-terminal domain-containing protein [Thalassospira sp. MA62]